MNPKSKRGHLKSIVCLMLAIVLLAPKDGICNQDKSLKEILNHIDRLFRGKSSRMEIEMQVETPNWKRSLQMDIWSKGLDYTFVTILTPVKDRGISTLKRKNEMWNYFPKINKVIKIPPSMMMSSWMGSDFTNDDLVKESTLQEDYNSTFGEGTKEEVYAIELVPKETAISLWGKIILEIDKKSLLPIQEIYFDEKGKKIRTLFFKEIASLGGRNLPTKLELIPHTKPGNKTTIIYKKAEFDLIVPDKVFTRSYLQKRR